MTAPIYSLLLYVLLISIDLGKRAFVGASCESDCIDDGHLPSRPFLKSALRLSASHLANFCDGVCPRGSNAIQLDTCGIGEGTPMIMFTAHRNIPMGSAVPEALN